MQSGSAGVRPLGARLALYASARVITPLAVLVGLALLLSALAVGFASERQDELQLAAEAQLIEHGVQSLGRSLATEARDYGWWDEAVQALVLRPDPDWVDANVGRYITDNFGYEVSVVLTGGDARPIYGQVDGVRDTPDAAARLGPDLLRLVTRAAEHRAGDEPRSRFAVLAGADGFYATGASPIVPAAGSVLTLPDGPPGVLVFAKRLDSEFLNSLEADFGLEGLAYAIEPPPRAGGRSAIPLAGVDGRPAGYIAWQPKRPGSGQLVLMLPGLLGSLLFCGFAVLLVGARERADRAISASAARFRDISETASDWIWETDARSRLTFVSDACRRSLGLAPADLLGRPIHQFLLPLDSGGSAVGGGDIAALASAGPFHGAVYRYRPEGGEPRVLRVAGKALIEGGAVQGYRGIATDITAEVAALEQARLLAHHDALTGLPNRALGTAAAVLCLDLDGFKEVNDSLGHGAGDLLLARCAERLRACLRAGDTVARQGGDEFTVLQADVERPEEVEGLCRRIVEVLAQPFDLDGRKALVTASIGAAVLPADGEDPALLLQRADMALYRAKTAGRNGYCFFEPGMDRQLRQRRQAEVELRSALAEGQFELRYQPQVYCASGALVGVEALLRWRHPERGTLLPAEFIPLAEETGIIDALGAWVLRAACRDAAGWPGLRVSVNLSPVQFRQRDLAATVAAALAEAGLPPGRLEVEVTEGLLVHDGGDAVAMLAELKVLGVRITMDDFGTGYSSLAYLQRFPFDKIKIDRSFIRQLGGRPNTRAIVRAIVQLGRSLSVPICAEGVETDRQLVQLRDEGCQEAQGFLFARPVPAGEVADLVSGWPVPLVEHRPPTPRAADRRTGRAGRSAA